MGKQKHFQARGILCVLVLLSSLMSVSTWGDFYDGGTLKELTLGDNNKTGNAPYFYATNDAAGYSDWIWYGPTDLHEHAYHEVLSGEWAAAVYYDGIDTSLTINPDDAADRRQAMYLTQRFSFPDFYTNSDFVYGGTCLAWHDSSNSVPNNNRAISVIHNNEVEVTIDYEVVDLESIGSAHSPMVYVTDPNTSEIIVIYSDRYIFLQTYTIKNLKDEILTGLELYQLLHSHGADEYGPQVNSTYTDVYALDPLASYTPKNPVHQVGTFCYDITQWNQRPFSRANHVDYVGFSCAVEPDWIDNDVFRGGHSDDLINEYTEGGYMNVKDRSLNEVIAVYQDEVCGSMGWSLGSLDPNVTTSLTVAFMFAPDVESPDLILVKTINDPNDCYSPGDQFTYTFSWQNISQSDAENAMLIDYLPAGLMVPISYSFDPNTFQFYSSDPNYDEGSNIYTWDLGTIPANSSGSKELTVMVTEKAEPGMTLTNEVVLDTSIGHVSASYDIQICCWDDGEIIYVDKHATGANSGLNWTDAYTDLQRALERAGKNCVAKTVYVAQGSYDPGRENTKTFLIPEDVSLYGGFPIGGCEFSERNPDRYPTILTGAADTTLNETVVTMGDDSLLDGFEVTGASEYGVYGDSSDFVIENCSLFENEKFGVYAEEANININWCTIKNNGWHGIYHAGENKLITVHYCLISTNNRYGVFTENSTPLIQNSIISENGYESLTYYGIRIYRPTNSPTLFNNTIVFNKNEGVSFTDNQDSTGDPNDKDWPDIQNCILWYNNGNGMQTAGFDSNTLPQYCCIYNPISDPNGVDYTLNTNDNFSGNPVFAYHDPNNLHLAYNSPCKDMGNPSHDSNDIGFYDMDGEERIIDSRVDIGADEIYSCDDDLSEDDIRHPLDWDSDGIVNLHEFTSFSRAWMSRDPNDPSLPSDPNLIDPNDFIGWNPICDLNEDYLVNLDDLAEFCEEKEIKPDNWLWRACWKQSQMNRFVTMYYSMMSSGGENMMMESMVFESSALSFDLPDTGIKDVEISELNTMEKSIVQILAVVEKDIREDAEHPDIEDLVEIKAFLEDCLVDIRSRK